MEGLSPQEIADIIEKSRKNAKSGQGTVKKRGQGYLGMNRRRQINKGGKND